MFKSDKGWTGTNKTFSIYANPNCYDKSAVKSKQIDFQVISNANTGAQLYKQGKLDFTLLSTTDLINANKKQRVIQSLNKHGQTILNTINPVKMPQVQTLKKH